MTNTLRSIVAVSAFAAASAFAGTMPAAGEFSAVDTATPDTSAPVVTRSIVREQAVAARRAAPVANGEIVYFNNGASEHTRAEVRAEGSQANKAHTLSVGDVNL